MCYGAVMQSLVKAGLLQEAAQVLLLMPQKGLWPDALLMADVLSTVDALAASAANSSINSLLQARSSTLPDPHTGIASKLDRSAGDVSIKQLRSLGLIQHQIAFASLTTWL